MTTSQSAILHQTIKLEEDKDDEYKEWTEDKDKDRDEDMKKNDE